ncbi:uncharacterized protein FMAN_06606 [Fusarium mangiferae]|uniref:PD-(D/E)XK nuclease-like domain-containing protein n=1 Tax=Fusarium mangiferae TaxID=192010 RepID=A0A1L7SHD0_FUSMA|nr:uncharacterized protein FMAN_06606 [Fusarium mangiferae]CVK85921.1 uncharacterized protein FMAN_06606 [Fusarium mangiferae]
MESSGELIPNGSGMVEYWLKRARTTGLPSDDNEEDKPAKKLKFNPINVSRRCAFPSPIDAPSPPTHGHQLPHGEECDSEAASSQASDYEYANHWVDFKTLNPDHNDMPATLKLFLASLLVLQKDKKIVPNTLRDEIEAHPRSDYTLTTLDDDSYYIPVESEPVYTKGLFDAVIKIAQAAQKCHSLQYDENGWNNLVYTPLLTAAVENFKPEERQSIDVAPCLGSVNHTQFVPTAEFPIAATIKTKSRSGNSQDAEVQLAAWQAAQWLNMAVDVGDNISELGFLPGIIIDGHEWRFHATTYGLPGNKTVR